MGACVGGSGKTTRGAWAPPSPPPPPDRPVPCAEGLGGAARTGQGQAALLVPRGRRCPEQRSCTCGRCEGGGPIDAVLQSIRLDPTRATVKDTDATCRKVESTMLTKYAPAPVAVRGVAFCSDFVVLQSSSCFSSVAFNPHIPQRGGAGGGQMH